jgi:hypothetical protein
MRSCPDSVLKEHKFLNTQKISKSSSTSLILEMHFLKQRNRTKIIRTLEELREACLNGDTLEIYEILHEHPSFLNEVSSSFTLSL